MVLLYAQKLLVTEYQFTHPPADGIYQSTGNTPIQWMVSINPHQIHPSTSWWHLWIHRKSTHPMDGIHQSTDNLPIHQWMLFTNPQKIHRISTHLVDGIHQSTENPQNIHPSSGWHPPIHRKSTEYPSIQWMASTNPQEIHRILEINPYGWELCVWSMW